MGPKLKKKNISECIHCLPKNVECFTAYFPSVCLEMACPVFRLDLQDRRLL